MLSPSMVAEKPALDTFVFRSCVTEVEVTRAQTRYLR